MKQKRKIVILGFLLIFILAAGLYYLMRDEGTLSDEDAWICANGFEGIVSVSIDNNPDSQVLSFVKGEDNWEGSDGSSYENEQFASYVAALGYMKADQKLGASASELEEYGLREPTYTVSVSYDSGEEFHYNIGKFIDNVGLYVSLDDEDSVYLIGSARGEVMDDMISSLYDVALSNVRFDEIRGIQIQTPENGLVSMNRSESPRANGDFYWNLFRPLAWTADTEKVNAMIAEVEEIGSLKRISKEVSPEECGLDGDESQLPSVSFYDTYDSELTIYLGDSEDDYVYCKTNYLDGIYFIHRDILNLLEIDVNTMVDTRMYYYETPSVESCSIVWQGESHELRAEWVLSGEDGERGQRFYLDDNSITGADYSTIANWFLECEVKQIFEKPDNQGEVMGTIVVNRLSPPYEQTLTFRTVQGDDSLAMVDMGGNAAVYIEMQQAEKLLPLLRQ